MCDPRAYEAFAGPRGELHGFGVGPLGFRAVQVDFGKIPTGKSVAYN